MVEVKGDIEVLGPSLSDINGGMGGVYIRSAGKEGKGTVKISVPGYDLSSEVDFTVSLLNTRT